MASLPTIRQLKYLTALAEHRHFGKAAAACFVTQSTLSAGLKELEDALDAPLVDRNKRSVIFTPLGEEIVERARTILDAAQGLVDLAQTAKAPLTGVVRMGIIPTIAPFVLPRVLPRLRADYPELKLHLREDLTARLLEQLTQGRLDVVLIALPVDTGTTEVMKLFDDPFFLAARARDPEAQGKRIDFHALDESRLLLLEDGHCLRDHALAACALDDVRSRGPVEATSLYTLVQMVENGLGFTLLPRMAVESGLLKGTGLIAKPFAKRAPARGIALAWRRGASRTADYRLLGSLIKSTSTRAA